MIKFKSEHSTLILKILFAAFCLVLPLWVHFAHRDSPFEYSKFLLSGFAAGLTCLLYALSRLYKAGVETFYYSKAGLILLSIVLVNVLSYLFSVNGYLSFWGDPLLPAGSFVSVFLFVGLALVYEQVMQKHKNALALVLLCALVPSALQVWDGFGSTVSRSTFIVALIPLLICFFLQASSRTLKWVILLLLVLSQLAVLQTGSRTPAAVQLLIQIGMLYFIYKKTQASQKYFNMSCIAAAVLISHLCFALMPAKPDNLQYKLKATELSKGFEVRQMLAADGLEAWLKKPLLGYGPEAYSIAQRQHHDPQLNTTEYWANAWTKAHNQLVHDFVSTGFLGGAAQLALVIYMLALLIGLFKQESPSIWAVGYAAGFVSLFLMNLTAFHFITTQFLYFLFPVAAASCAGQVKSIELRKYLSEWGIKLFFVSMAALMAGLVYYFNQHRKADLLFQTSYAAFYREQNISLALEAGLEAAKTNPKEPLYNCHMAQVYAGYLQKNKNSARAQDILKVADEFAKKCLERAINREFYFTRAGVIYAELFFAGLLPTAEKALKVFNQAVSLAPHNPELQWRIALIRRADGDEADFVQRLTRALDLKEDYLPAYYELFQFYYAQNEVEAKNQLLQRFVNMNSRRPEHLELVQSLVRVAEKYSDAAAQRAFQQKYDELLPLFRR